MTLAIFSGTYLYLLWWTVYSSLLPIFWVICLITSQNSNRNYPFGKRNQEKVVIKMMLYWHKTQQIDQIHWLKSPETHSVYVGTWCIMAASFKIREEETNYSTNSAETPKLRPYLLLPRKVNHRWILYT